MDSSKGNIPATPMASTQELMCFGGPQHGPENRIMMSRDRMAFGGPQVQSNLTMGGYVIYVSPGQNFRLTTDTMRTEKKFIAIVPPYVKHTVIGPRNLRSILCEAETVSPDILADSRFHDGSAAAKSLALRVEAAFQRWQAGDWNAATESFDLFFFGTPLPPRLLDERIAKSVAYIRNSTDMAGAAMETIARRVALSPSRLRHLFSEQVGVSIRSFRAWKRLRNAIHIALKENNILKLAMAAGYADSTHLCHSVKLYFGEQPSWVCAHWRNATFVCTNTRERAVLN